MKAMRTSLLLVGLIFWMLACSPNSSWFQTDGRGNENPPRDSEPRVSTSLRLGDRHYVASALTQWFVPSSVDVADTNERNALLNTIQSLVRSQVADFGGACDFYESTQTNCGRDRFGNPTLELTQIPAWTSTSSSRAALTQKTLLSLLNPSPRELALRQIISLATNTSLANVDLSTILPPTQEQMILLFRTFYTGQTPSASSLQTYQDLVDQILETEAPKEAWRFLILSMLQSMAWQIL